MAHMEWTRDLEFGIPVIDAQHKRIVDFINELDDACRTGNSKETHNVMEDLFHYTKTHFGFEENLQEKAGYPYLKAHRRVHENFMKTVTAFRERCHKGEDVGPELLKLLSDWLVSHIKSEDLDYVESVKKLTDSEDHEVAGWMNTTLKSFFG